MKTNKAQPSGQRKDNGIVRHAGYSITPYRFIGITTYRVEKQKRAQGNGFIEHYIPLFYWPREAIKKHNPELFLRLTAQEGAQ